MDKEEVRWSQHTIADTSWKCFPSKKIFLFKCDQSSEIDAKWRQFPFALFSHGSENETADQNSEIYKWISFYTSLLQSLCDNISLSMTFVWTKRAWCKMFFKFTSTYLCWNCSSEILNNNSKYIAERIKLFFFSSSHLTNVVYRKITLNAIDALPSSSQHSKNLCFKH